MLNRLTKIKYYREYKKRFDYIFHKLEDISKLEDDWNQYGAKPLSLTTIDDNEYFLHKFKKSKLSHSAIMHDKMIFAALNPDIFPTARDTIQLEIEPASGFYFQYEFGRNFHITTKHKSTLYMRFKINDNILKISKEDATFVQVFLHIKTFYYYYIYYLLIKGDITELIYNKFSHDILLA